MQKPCQEPCILPANIQNLAQEWPSYGWKTGPTMAACTGPAHFCSLAELWPVLAANNGPASSQFPTNVGICVSVLALYWASIHPALRLATISSTCIVSSRHFYQISMIEKKKNEKKSPTTNISKDMVTFIKKNQ